MHFEKSPNLGVDPLVKYYQMGTLGYEEFLILLCLIADVRHPSFDMIPQVTTMKELESKINV